MTTVTLPTVTPPPESPGGVGRLPRPGRYAVAPGRSLVELTGWYGPLPTRRRRVTLTGASLTVPEPGVPGTGESGAVTSSPSEQPVFRFELTGLGPPSALTSSRAALVSQHVEPFDDGQRLRLRLLADLELGGVLFPVLLWLRVVERADDRLLVVGTARLPYRLLRRATGFRLGRLCPATRLRLLVAAEFA
ncbi:hypothetical protein [Streptomyces sp. NPDC046862]|uniref:hypothetical protein n=1 Tax=Streptomyces sp. NPDC046862 TaxID=3154603 RepID=UPI003453F6AA